MSLTNLPLSRLGLGLAALGRPGYINLGHGDDLQGHYLVSDMKTQAHAVLDAAWAGGVRYFDVARSYGRAEAFLASWLQKRNVDPTQITVGSKWGYTYTADWQVTLDPGIPHEVKEHSLDVLERQIEQSRSHLGNYLRLYQIHSATLESGVLQNVLVLTELARLREAGLIIGFSVSGPGQTQTILRGLDIELDGRPLFGAVQATWNLLEQSASPALAQAHAQGLTVIVKEALANGRLTPRNPDPEFQPAMARLQRVARQNSVSVDALALAAALHQPWAQVVLSGAATVTQLASNLAAQNLVWQEGWTEALSGLQEIPDFYWQQRSQLAWN